MTLLEKISLGLYSASAALAAAFAIGVMLALAWPSRGTVPVTPALLGIAIVLVVVVFAEMFAQRFLEVRKP